MAFFSMALIVFLRRDFMAVDLCEQAAGKAHILWSAGGICIVAGLLAPKVMLPFYLLLTVSTFPIGFATSYIAFFLIFYGAATPLGIALKIMGKKAIELKFDRTADSYWIKRKPERNINRYYRQF